MPYSLYFMWYQGLRNAPTLVRRNYELWQGFNPRLPIRIIERDEAETLVRDEGIDPAYLSVQVLSDLVRVILLAEHGGIWADATVMPVTPLAQWLTSRLEATGFFAFSNANSDRLLSSWFLAAKVHDRLAQRWRALIVDYFRRPRQASKQAPLLVKLGQAWRIRRDAASFARPDVAARTRYYPYHILHYHFGYLVEKDPEAAAEWRAVPTLPAREAGRLKRACVNANGPLDPADIERLLSASPVHKLNWRKPDLFARALDAAERRVTGNPGEGPVRASVG